MTETGPQQTLLLLEDDEVFSQVLCRSLQRRGYQVLCCQTLEEAREVISEHAIDGAILDLKLEHATSLSLIPQIRSKNAQVRILVLTGYASIATAVDAIKLGANNYLPKPANTEEILNALLEEQTAIEQPEEEPHRMSVERLEWEHIQSALKQNDGNISKTARELNMHRRTLQRKLQKRPVQQ